jgi:hypothetical protein
MEDAMAVLAGQSIPQPPVDTIELALAQERKAAGVP